MLDKLLGSRVRAKLLGWLFIHHDERYFVRQLTELLKEDSTNVSRELSRLGKMGILTCEEEGKQKYYKANPECTLFDELCGLAIKTIGVADVLHEALEPLADKIETAFVYGSYATNTSTSQSDIDLFIVGSVDETILHKAVMTAEEQLKRTVSYRFMNPKEFKKRKANKDGFVLRVLNGPKIDLLGCSNEL